MNKRDWIYSVIILAVLGAGVIVWGLLKASSSQGDAALCDASGGHCEAITPDGRLAIRILETAAEIPGNVQAGSGWTLDLQVQGMDSTKAPKLLLEGRDMFMGSFPVQLKAGYPGNTYLVSLLAPVCTVNPDMRWQLRVTSGDSAWLIWLPRPQSFHTDQPNP